MIPKDGSDASLGRGAALTRFGAALGCSASARRVAVPSATFRAAVRRGNTESSRYRCKDERPAGGPGHDGGESRHRWDLQGLRAVAVLLVVAAHAGVGFLAGGYVGVDVFFVLSGFLITGLLLARAVGPRTLSFRTSTCGGPGASFPPQH